MAGAPLFHKVIVPDVVDEDGPKVSAFAPHRKKDCLVEARRGLFR